jgi:hypothetical protein
MDHSLLSARRTAHLKIAMVAIVCATVVILVGMNAKTADFAAAHIQANGGVVKAGQPAVYSAWKALVIR